MYNMHTKYDNAYLETVTVAAVAAATTAAPPPALVVNVTVQYNWQCLQIQCQPQSRSIALHCSIEKIKTVILSVFCISIRNVIRLIHFEIWMFVRSVVRCVWLSQYSCLMTAKQIHTFKPKFEVSCCCCCCIVVMCLFIFPQSYGRFSSANKRKRIKQINRRRSTQHENELNFSVIESLLLLCCLLLLLMPLFRWARCSFLLYERHISLSHSFTQLSHILACSLSPHSLCVLLYIDTIAWAHLVFHKSFSHSAFHSAWQ